MNNICDKNIPIVSVVIDTYNLDHFIGDAIQSVLSQDFSSKDLEIIVVDDGSTDDTSTRLNKYKNIKYIYKKNGGQASALNKAFQHCNGKYITLLDADDFMLPGRIEKVVEEFETYNEVCCVLNSRKFIVDNVKLYDSFPEFHNIGINKEDIDLIIESQYGTSRTSIRRSVLDKVLPIPESLRIEADLYLNLAILWFGNISSLKDELTAYRIHGDNLFCITDKSKLPLQISSMESALFGIRKISKLSDIYDEELLNKLLKPYEIELNDKNHLMDIFNDNAKRKDSFRNELEKIRLDWNKWNITYKFYKLFRLPLFYIFSPKTLNKAKGFYMKKNLKKIRNLIFANR